MKTALKTIAPKPEHPPDVAWIHQNGTDAAKLQRTQQSLHIKLLTEKHYTIETRNMHIACVVRNAALVLQQTESSPCSPEDELNYLALCHKLFPPWRPLDCAHEIIVVHQDMDARVCQ